jgi:UV DNA damage endonuclease
MYRISSDLAHYVTHPDLPQFHGQIEKCAAELAAIGNRRSRSRVQHTALLPPLTVRPAQ